MPTCFLIQPFDNDAFDRRCSEVIKPAVSAAGLVPYRVDEDAGAAVLIDAIEQNIRGSALCLADVTTNNPNVWFELGFAIASGKEVVLICSKSRESRFPFDIQHRKIIQYSTESPSDMEQLKHALVTRLKALVAKAGSNERMAIQPTLAPIEGLDQMQITALAAIAASADIPDSPVSASQVKRDIENAGFNALAANVALQQLANNDLVQLLQIDDQYSDGPYWCYKLTDSGWSWIRANLRVLNLKSEPIRRQQARGDEMPF